MSDLDTILATGTPTDKISLRDYLKEKNIYPVGTLENLSDFADAENKHKYFLVIDDLGNQKQETALYERDDTKTGVSPYVVTGNQGEKYQLIVPFGSGGEVEQILSGEGDPAVSLGSNGDIYIDKLTFNVWEKNDQGTWEIISNILENLLKPAQPLSVTPNVDDEIEIDLDNGRQLSFNIDVTKDIEVQLPTNSPQNGLTFFLYFKMDGTGGHQVTFEAGYGSTNNEVVTVHTGPSSKTIIAAHIDFEGECVIVKTAENY